MRLRRSDCSGTGIARRRAGRGFVYIDRDGQRITGEEELARIKGLAIPPAWREVWICPQPNGHIQATGLDEAGRKQYLYHEGWTRRRAAEKFKSMLLFSAALPRLRRAVGRDLDPARPVRASVLACAIRLIDLGHFRVGGEQYAEENQTFGLATILRSQVSLPADDPDSVEFAYEAKGAKDRDLAVRDRAVRRLAEKLQRRRSGPDDFLVYEADGEWRDVRSDDVNDYIREHAGEGFSAKDFRTWNGTLLAAVHLARAGDPPSSSRGRERAIREAIEVVSEELGNTPAVARDSYIDPRILDRYRDGEVVPLGSRPGRRSRTGLSSAERAVLRFLAD